MNARSWKALIGGVSLLTLALIVSRVLAQPSLLPPQSAETPRFSEATYALDAALPAVAAPPLPKLEPLPPLPPLFENVAGVRIQETPSTIGQPVAEQVLPAIEPVSKLRFGEVVFLDDNRKPAVAPVVRETTIPLMTPPEVAPAPIVAAAPGPAPVPPRVEYVIPDPRYQSIRWSEVQPYDPTRPEPALPTEEKKSSDPVVAEEKPAGQSAPMAKQTTLDEILARNPEWTKPSLPTPPRPLSEEAESAPRKLPPSVEEALPEWKPQTPNVLPAVTLSPVEGPAGAVPKQADAPPTFPPQPLLPPVWVPEEPAAPVAPVKHFPPPPAEKTSIPAPLPPSIASAPLQPLTPSAPPPRVLQPLADVPPPKPSPMQPKPAPVQPAQVQPTQVQPTQVPSVVPAFTKLTSDGPGTIQLASCSNCGNALPPRVAGVDGGFGPGGPGSGGCSRCGSGGRVCSPGHLPCYPCNASGPCGQFLCDLYECICCIDPCYEPRWIPVANAAFFVEGARPVTQQTLRFDAGYNLRLPDRSEYFWARADNNGKGPRLPNGVIGETSLRYYNLTIVNEVALGKASMIVETPYVAQSPDLTAHGSGFGDIAFGPKTLLYDCEMLQVAMMFKTYMPVGIPLKGVGTGHVSLEPSFMFALKLDCDNYLQLQLSEWIPIGGDPTYAGSVFHTHTSFNTVLARILPDVPLIATAELNTWSFQDGAFTHPDTGAFQQSSGTTYVSVGPGLRLSVCDKIDFGIGTAFSVTRDHFAAQLIRFQGRVRF